MHHVSTCVCSAVLNMHYATADTGGVLHCKWNADSCDTADSVLKRVSYKPGPAGRNITRELIRNTWEYIGIHGKPWDQRNARMSFEATWNLFQSYFVSCETIDRVGE